MKDQAAMTEQMTQDEVLASLKGVVRIAKAASVGVTGNGPRIDKAEQAITAVAALIARNAELEAKVNEYRLEYDNPAKDYVRRSLLRDQLFALAARRGL